MRGDGTALLRADGTVEYLIACESGDGWNDCYSTAREVCPAGYETVAKDGRFNRKELRVACSEPSRDEWHESEDVNLNAQKVVPVRTAPVYATPPVFAPFPAGVIESRIDGEFTGWDGETLFKLQNGQIWQQSSYNYVYHYAYSPEVLIYPSGGRYKMRVEGVDQAVWVQRLK
jgi:hypothetical protein